MLNEIKKTVKLLDDLNVPYVLIGGLAVSVHGYPRATIDVDFLIDVQKSLYPKIKEVFEANGAKVNVSKSSFDDPVGDVFNITFNGTRVQLITAKWAWEREAIKHCRIEKINSFKVNVPALEYLLILKEKAGGTKDRLDVDNLLAINNGKIQEDLLNRLRKKYFK